MYDLAVVGHGAAGLSAAVAAAEQVPGARIAVIERTPESTSGGNTRWSPGNTRLTSLDETPTGFEDELLATTGGRGDRAYFRRMAAAAPETLRWAERQGVRFDTVGYYLSPEQKRLQPVGRGAAVVKALADRAKQLGVEFHYEARAARLQVASEEGSSHAVETDDGRRFAAKALVLATGGFAGSPEMLREHFGPGGECLKPISPGTAANAGEGIRMALAAGALPSGDWNGMHIEPVDRRSERAAALVLVYPYGIIVDGEGRRFFDEGEGLVHETWEHLSRAIHFQAPGRSAWTVLDSRLSEITGHEDAIRSEVPPLKSDTLAGLAQLMGVPARSLEETVSEYNAACTGDPAQFHPGRRDGLATSAALAPRKSNWARPLDRPPFLAFPLVGAIVYTFGGIATDAEARVLGAEGPIKGLYAAGEITGHFYGTAPNAVALLRALVFGRIAGLNAIGAAS